MTKVRVFTSTSCPYCISLIKFLEKHNIPFEEIDVTENPEAQQEVIEKSGELSLPVTEIDGKIVVGFDKERIVKLLGIKG